MFRVLPIDIHVHDYDKVKADVAGGMVTQNEVFRSDACNFMSPYRRIPPAYILVRRGQRPDSSITLHDIFFIVLVGIISMERRMSSVGNIFGSHAKRSFATRHRS